MPLYIQIKAFALTLLFGILMGVVFHYYFLIIRRGRVRRFPLYLFDLIIWIIILLVAFISLLIINQGEMRVYVLLAMACGVVIYLKLFAGLLGSVMGFMADTTVTAIGGIKFVVLKPFHLGTRFLKKTVSYIRQVFFKPPPGDNKE